MDGRRRYDWWSRNQWALRALYGVAFLGRERTLRRRSIAVLDLKAGECVLDVGCGPGTAFAALREGVGPTGTVVGIDTSPGMVAAARERVARAGWDNVHVVRGDATRPGISESVDAIYAAMSLSAMPDPAAAVSAAADTVAADGRLVALDARPFPRGPLALVNPLLVPLFGWLTNWDAATDIPAAVDGQFEGRSIYEANAGSIYIVEGHRPT
jgi:demethylmenaquinone methyltransferase/2-methoxy-6-polyprenyl-1,4-benzoquinol methylase